jgi:hypothetical protein
MSQYIVHHDGTTDEATTNQDNAMVAVLEYSFDGHPAWMETIADVLP